MTRVVRASSGGIRVSRRRFVVRSPTGDQRETSQTITVGSSRAADLRVRDPSVSRLHVRFEAAADGVRVVDLDSTNGTVLAGVRIRDAIIERSCTVHIGLVPVAVEVASEFDDTDLGPHTHFGDLLGASSAMRLTFATLADFARTDRPILLLGESGTGKELAAEAIHAASPRSNGPFVVVDCGAIPATLIEAELFGHEKGAFTGALTTREGAFEAAHQGTLFLDEVGELELSLQPRLLRAVESQRVKRIGDNTTRHVDVRIVAATNRDLARMVSNGDFREDLFYRLNVLATKLPPLREREGDIPILARHFAELAAEKYPQARPAVLTDEVLADLEKRTWPGNARELRNFVERAVVLGPRSSDYGRVAEATDDSWSQLPFHEAREAAIGDFERRYVEDALKRTGGNVAAAARACGVHRGYLFRLIRRHKLKK